MLPGIRDPIVRRFWQHTFPSYGTRFQTEALDPVINKLERLLANRTLRNILAQPKSTIRVDEIIANRKILIANLSKGSLGEDSSDFLGSILVAQLYLSALRRLALLDTADPDDATARSSILDTQPHCFCYVDEFQSFAIDTFESMLSETRKVKLSLALFHQYTAQLDERLQRAVFGNVGSCVVFGVGARDADLLEPELPIPARNLVELGKYQVWVRLLADGTARDPFAARTLPPPTEARHGRGGAVIRRCRARHAQPRDRVEATINRWLAAA